MAYPYQAKPVTTGKTDDPMVASQNVAVGTTVQLKSIQQRLRQGGGVFNARRVVTASDLISSTDQVIYADTTSGNITMRLPKASEYPFMQVYVKRSAGANTLTVAARTGDTVDGGASVTVTNAVLFQPKDKTTWTALSTSV